MAKQLSLHIEEKMEQDIIAFNFKFGLNRIPNDEELHKFRYDFLLEELVELRQEHIQCVQPDIEKILRELVDVEYVRMGTQTLVYFDVYLTNKWLSYYELLQLVGKSKILVEEVKDYYSISNSCFLDCWNEVHSVNMNKVRTENPNDSKRNSSFDIIKPPNWVEPDLKPIVQKYQEEFTNV